ncbi:MAG: hypothetical protein SWH61_13895 [Thermodesulfobacteriota bacterium]|nr:hypothetical protein [Thermodesulfobacteriota bacterium]
MVRFLEKFLWLVAGVFFIHAGHYIYQTYYAETFAKTSTSESIAILFEDLLKGIVVCLDRFLPMVAASQDVILIVIMWSLVVVVSLIGFRIGLKIRGNRAVARQMKEAEEIRENAESEAAQKLKENKELKQRLLDEFKKKEAALQKSYKQKITEFKTRIKTLEKERLELKETNGELMRRLKQKKE